MRRLPQEAVDVYKKGFIRATFIFLANFLSYPVFVEKFDSIFRFVDRFTSIGLLFEWAINFVGLLLLLTLLVTFYPIYFVWIIFYYYPITMIRLYYQNKAALEAMGIEGKLDARRY